MDEIKENLQLKDLNTFAVKARAKYFTEVESKQGLKDVLNNKKISPVHILGGGSNILFKNDISGLVIKNNIQGFEVLEEDEQEIYIKVKSGENWNKFVRYCVKNNYWGIENLGLIPGTLGGAILQNAGAYGVEIKDVITKVEGVKLSSLKNFIFSKQECDFSYRDSIFKKKEGKFFITSATLKLNKGGNPNLEYGSIQKELNNRDINNPTVKNIYNTVCEIRRNKLPDWTKTGTAGSFFKNPFVNQEILKKLKKSYPDIPNFQTEEGTKLSAGWLIENAEINSDKFPGVELYPNHSLIIINSNDAEGKVIYQFSEYIKNKVSDKFDIELEREVRVW